MPQISFGYHMPSFSFPDVPPEKLFDHVADLACSAENAGFDLVTVMDHFYQIRGVGPETEPMLEAYTTLGGLAARTRRVKLGTLVTGVTYRNPALLVKQVTTLDTISGGRAVLGIGAAWNEDEHRGYGFAFPPVRERMDRLNEALQIARAMFSEQRPSFRGRFYQIDQALNSPRPIQPGGPPILIGGTGEKRTLRMVAQYADMSHWFATSLDDLQRKSDILQRYCDDLGRDASQIYKWIGAPVLLAANQRELEQLKQIIPPERQAMIIQPSALEQAADQLRAYIDAGFRGFTFGNPNVNTPEKLEMIGSLKRLLS